MANEEVSIKIVDKDKTLLQACIELLASTLDYMPSEDADKVVKQVINLLKLL